MNMFYFLASFLKRADCLNISMFNFHKIPSYLPAYWQKYRSLKIQSVAEYAGPQESVRAGVSLPLCNPLRNNLALHGQVGYAQTLSSSLFLCMYPRKTPVHLYREHAKSGKKGIVCMCLSPGFYPKVK